jgi:hypothetical protein
MREMGEMRGMKTKNFGIDFILSPCPQSPVPSPYSLLPTFANTEFVFNKSNAA